MTRKERKKTAGRQAGRRTDRWTRCLDEMPGHWIATGRFLATGWLRTDRQTDSPPKRDT